MVSEPLRELLDTEKTVAYRLAHRADGLRCDWAAGSRFAAARFARAFDSWLEGRGINVAAYNPLRPEPEQRNVALRLSDLRRIGFITPSGAPKGEAARQMADQLWPRFDLHARDQLRVLVCDGPSLLAWVGAFQPDLFKPRQKRILARLVPALRRRLILERALEQHAAVHAALDAAMEAIGAPAFLLDSSGSVLHCNAAGKVRVARGGRTALVDLREAVHGDAGDRFRVTRVAARGASDRFLVVEKATDAPLAACVSRAAARWELTPREGEVLGWLARGKTNRTIAALLGIAERTVETHVTAVLAKACVESRSALTARLLEQ